MAAWFRSPSGVLAHADGPSQVRAYTDRGYEPVDEATAKREIGDGLRLSIGSRVAGTFDEESVRRAVREESPRTQSHRQAVAHARRSAAARKGAETKAAKKAAEKPSEGDDTDEG